MLHRRLNTFGVEITESTVIKEWIIKGVPQIVHSACKTA